MTGATLGLLATRTGWVRIDWGSLDEAAASELSNADYYREVRRRERG